MICLRCGHCCKTSLVVIVDNPELGITENNIIAVPGTGCKHLLGDSPGEYTCAVHDYPWYVETPCFEYTQIESENSNCRVGEYILKSNRKE